MLFLILFGLKPAIICAQKKSETSGQIKLTLAQVWQKANEYSKQIQISELGVRKSSEEIKNAEAERLPEIAVGGNYEKATNIPMYENGLFHKPTQHEVIHRLYKVGADTYFNIYNGNKTNYEIAKEETLHQIALETKKLTVSQIRLRAAAYYLELQKGYIFKDLMLKDIAEREKELIEIKNFLKHGVVLKSDVLRAELKLSQQKLSLVQIENDIKIANQKLNILIGEPDERLILPESETQLQNAEIKSYEEYLNEATEKSFEFNISEHTTQLKKIELNTTKANVSPRIGFYGDFYYANPQIFLYPYSPHLYSLGVAGIKASFPISSFYHNKHKVRAARLEYESQELEHSDTGDKVRQDVKEAYLRLTEARLRIDVAKVNVEQAKENQRIISNTYFNQTSLITELLDADVQLLQTRFEYAAALLNAELKYYQLQNIIGNL